MIQSFREKTVLPPRWDWRELVMEKVRQKFPPDYMFENYIASALLGVMSRKTTDVQINGNNMTITET